MSSLKIIRLYNDWYDCRKCKYTIIHHGLINDSELYKITTKTKTIGYNEYKYTVVKFNHLDTYKKLRNEIIDKSKSTSDSQNLSKMIILPTQIELILIIDLTNVDHKKPYRFEYGTYFGISVILIDNSNEKFERLEIVDICSCPYIAVWDNITLYNIRSKFFQHARCDGYYSSKGFHCSQVNRCSYKCSKNSHCPHYHEMQDDEHISFCKRSNIRRRYHCCYHEYSPAIIFRNCQFDKQIID